MDSGVGPNGRDGQPEPDEKTPPDAEAMRLGRARIAGGQPYTPGEPVMMARPGGSDPSRSSDLIGANELIGGTPDPSTDRSGGSSAGGSSDPSHSSDPNRSSGLIGAAPQAAGSDTIDLSPRFRPWSESATSGSQPQICHFLRNVGPDGKLGDPRRTAVPTHRCAAFGDPLPLSLRQQELVCLQRVHVSCPRYLRGTLLATETPATAAAAAVGPGAKPKKRFAAGFSLTMMVGIALMVLTLLLVVTGFAGRLPFLSSSATATAPLIAANSSPSGSAEVTPTPSPVAYTTPGPTSTPIPTATATTRATATATTAPTATPTPKTTPVASATWPPGATASRMNLVVACGDQANCYIYTVRSGAQNGSGATDTLAGVCRFFGVDVNAVKTLNPGLGGTAIKPGQKLRIPSPTR